MAFHEVCKSDASEDPTYRLIPESKYDSDCGAKDKCLLGGKIKKGQPIWYYSKDSTTSSKPSASELESLKKQIKDLEYRLKKAEEMLSNWSVFEGVVANTIDWGKLPQVNKSANSRTIASDKDVVDLFDGTEAFEVA